MQVRYACPYWGLEGTRASLFFARAFEAGFDGVEINFPFQDDMLRPAGTAEFVAEFQSSLANIRTVKKNFAFIAQQVLPPAIESVDAYIVRMKSRLEYLVTLQPDFINSHTGKDYYSFDDNCRIIEAAEEIAMRSGVPILHETHRGRFTFHAASTLAYLDKFPQLKLTGDFSHWCTVSESMLNDQQTTLDKIIPHIHHIHARVGFEHSPQVNDPFAPEWKQHMQIFIGWWDRIIKHQGESGKSCMTITPEFGPVPYMPTLPYSNRPMADQWQINAQMKEMLKRTFDKKVHNSLSIL